MGRTSHTSCKGTCNRYKAPMRYKEGIVNCRTCGIFIYWDGIYCPCCGVRVSRRVRSGPTRKRNTDRQIRIE